MRSILRKNSNRSTFLEQFMGIKQTLGVSNLLSKKRSPWYKRIAKALYWWINLCHLNNFPLSNGQSGCNPAGVSVNLKKKFGTHAYIYNYYGDSGTYTANLGYTITMVKHGRRVIWQSKNVSDIAYHVRVEGLGSSSKSVTIFHSSGEKTKFTKNGGFCGLFTFWEQEKLSPIYTVEDKTFLDDGSDDQEDTTELKRLDLVEEQAV